MVHDHAFSGVSDLLLEQTAIATIFGDIAPGIASLEASCDKTRALKRDIRNRWLQGIPISLSKITQSLSNFYCLP
jgi:hypothetical protein